MRFKNRFLWLLLLLIASSLYFPLNQLLTNGYNLKTAFDVYIPVLPMFALPYLLFVPFWVVAFLFAAWKMNDQLFGAFMIASVSGAVIAALVYFVFPTYTARPQIDTSGWDAKLLNLIYANDNVFNAFPSGHVLYTTLIALFGIAWYPNWSWALNGSIVLVIVSTLFTGQHHLVDPLGGLALAWGSYHFGLWAERIWRLRWKNILSKDKGEQAHQGVYQRAGKRF